MPFRQQLAVTLVVWGEPERTCPKEGASPMWLWKTGPSTNARGACQASQIFYLSTESRFLGEISHVLELAINSIFLSVWWLCENTSADRLRESCCILWELRWIARTVLSNLRGSWIYLWYPGLKLPPPKKNAPRKSIHIKVCRQFHGAAQTLESPSMLHSSGYFFQDSEPCQKKSRAQNPDKRTHRSYS